VWPRRISRILTIAFLSSVLLALTGTFLRAHLGETGDLLVGVAGWVFIVTAGLLILGLIVSGLRLVSGPAVNAALLIPRTLFLRARFRLSDLVLTVALLGNAEGLIFSRLLKAEPEYALPFAILAAIWILQGVAWGAWVATRLGIEHLTQRWFVILIGLAVPLIPILFCIGGFHLYEALRLLAKNGADDLASSLLSLIQGALAASLGFAFLRYAIGWHRKAKAAQPLVPEPGKVS
jgi:hypothetical protein